MSKHYYRDVKLIKFCKKCGVEYRPPRFTFFAMFGLCWKCRRPYYKKFYNEVWKPWFAKQTPEMRAKIKGKRYLVWKIWVTKNEIKRRQQALASYHKNKEKYRGRRHRATKNFCK